MYSTTGEKLRGFKIYVLLLVGTPQPVPLSQGWTKTCPW